MKLLQPPPIVANEEKWVKLFQVPLESFSSASTLEGAIRAGAAINWQGNHSDKRTISESSPAEKGWHYFRTGGEEWYAAKLYADDSGNKTVKIYRVETDVPEKKPETKTKPESAKTAWSEAYFIPNGQLPQSQRGYDPSTFVVAGFKFPWHDGGAMTVTSSEKKGNGAVFKLNGSDELFFCGIRNNRLQVWSISKNEPAMARVRPQTPAVQTQVLGNTTFYALPGAKKDSLSISRFDFDLYLNISSYEQRFQVYFSSWPGGSGEISDEQYVTSFSRFMRKDEGRSSFVGFLKERIRIAYSNLGLEDYFKFDEKTANLVKNRLKNISINYAKNSNTSLTTFGGDGGGSSIELGGSISLHHELFHVCSGSKRGANLQYPSLTASTEPILEEGMNALLEGVSDAYPKRQKALRSFLMKLPIAERKKTMDALVLAWLNIDSPTSRIADGALKKILTTPEGRAAEIEGGSNLGNL